MQRRGGKCWVKKTNDNIFYHFECGFFFIGYLLGCCRFYTLFQNSSMVNSNTSFWAFCLFVCLYGGNQSLYGRNQSLKLPNLPFCWHYSISPLWMTASSSYQIHVLPLYVGHLRKYMFLVYRSPNQECCTKDLHVYPNLMEMMRFELWSAAIMKWDFWRRSISNVGETWKVVVRGYTVVDHFKT